MNSQDPISPEMVAVLKRYLQIQAEEQRLKEEKAVLQKTLAGHLAQMQTEVWRPVVEDCELKVFARSSVTIDYDETKLRERLGSRYPSILEPDVRKIRQHLKEVESALAPVLDLIGSPSPDRIRDSIEKGLTRKEEYAGAFEKTTRHKVSVMKVVAGEERKDPEA